MGTVQFMVGKRKKWVIGAAVAVSLCAYGLAQLAYRFDYGSAVAEQYASDIAIGLIKAEDGYALGRAYPEKEVPTCDTSYKKEDSYVRCVMLGRRSNKVGCAWWRFENCTAFSAESYLLTRSDLLGPTIDAVNRPCRYLPDMTDLAVSQAIDKRSAHEFVSYWHSAGCDRPPQGHREKIIINFYDQKEAIVARYILY